MAKGSNPKERILAVASRLFFAQGYTATGINQILDEASVAKASLYQHYGSKEELGLVYLQRAREDWFQSFYRFLGNKRGADQIISIFDFMEQNVLSNDFKGCRFLNLLPEVSALPEMREEIVAQKTKLRTFIQSAVSEVISDKLKAASAADTVYLLYEGALMECKVYRNIWPVRAAKKTVKGLLEKEI